MKGDSLVDTPKSMLPQRGCWAPGDYLCKCSQCGKRFEGDKRAISCAPCAYQHIPQVDVEAAKLLGKISDWRKDGKSSNEILDEVRIHLRKLVGIDDYN